MSIPAAQCIVCFHRWGNHDDDGSCLCGNCPGYEPRQPNPNAVHTLYRMYSKDDELLYVGISMSVASRLAQHSRQKVWFEEIVTIRLEYFDTREESETAERKAVETEHPKYNVKLVPCEKTSKSKYSRQSPITLEELRKAVEF